MENNNLIAIIDGNSLIFRAYYAMKNPMITTTNIYTHAVYGFINMLTRVMREHEPCYIAIAFDRKAPTFRHLEYDAYKAGRKETPDELGMQFPLLKEVLDAMNITCLEMDGFEADDLIGTVAKAAELEGLKPLVITGDRDELQLISERTSVLITKKGVSEFELYTPEVFKEKYGFSHELFVDFKGLMGDQSDNIPGLPGVGEKTATKLITEFGGIEDIMERLSEVKPDRIRGIIEDNAQTALMSKRLAAIVTNAPMEINIPGMAVQEPDIDKLRAIYEKLEFRSLLKKLDNGTDVYGGSADETNLPPELRSGTVKGGSGTGKPGGSATDPLSNNPSIEKIQIEPKDFNIIDIKDSRGLELLRADLDDGKSIVLKIIGEKDHVGNPKVDIIYICTDKNLYCAIVPGNDNILQSIADIIAENRNALIGCDLQQDIYILKILAQNSEREYSPKIDFDAKVTDYLLEAGRASTDISSLVSAYSLAELPALPEILPQQTMLPGMNAEGTADSEDAWIKDAVDYGLKYSEVILGLRPHLEKRLEDFGQVDLCKYVELPLAACLADVEMQGFKFDERSLGEITNSMNARISELTDGIYEMAGEEFNINSPKQLGEILFSKLGLIGGKRNKKGFSTNADILEKLRFEHPIISLVLEFRTLMKLRSTYIEGLPKFVGADGKIRAHFMQSVTATGRLSCTDPNLQNIPVRQEPGRFIRKAFVAESGEYILMGADYSQIELRILAHLSDDPQLISDFCSGADIHSRTAARVFGVANEEDVTQEQRGAAKAVNFGIVYGMSSFGLSEELSIGVKDAGRYIAGYFAEHTKVKEYLDGCIDEVKKKGYSETILGRRRKIPELFSDIYNVRQYGERLAMNSPVQGSAADIIKVAMNKVYARLTAEGLSSKLILQVHDELILQVPVSEREAAASILKEEMEGAATLKVPLTVQIKTGMSWYDLK